LEVPEARLACRTERLTKVGAGGRRMDSEASSFITSPPIQETILRK